jgi:hypothetical protein
MSGYQPDDTDLHSRSEAVGAIGVEGGFLMIFCEADHER